MNHQLIRRSLAMRTRKITFMLALVVALAAVGAAQNRGKLTLDLYLDWESVAGPQLSPDGAQIVFTRRWTDKVNDKYESDVWIMNADGSRQRFLVKGSSPQWSPDGRRIAFNMSVPARQEFTVRMPQRPAGAKWVDPPRVIDRLDYRADT